MKVRYKVFQLQFCSPFQIHTDGIFFYEANHLNNFFFFRFLSPSPLSPKFLFFAISFSFCVAIQPSIASWDDWWTYDGISGKKKDTSLLSLYSLLPILFLLPLFFFFSFSLFPSSIVSLFFPLKRLPHHFSKPTNRTRGEESEGFCER